MERAILLRSGFSSALTSSINVETCHWVTVVLGLRRVGFWGKMDSSGRRGASDIWLEDSELRSSVDVDAVEDALIERPDWDDV